VRRQAVDVQGGKWSWRRVVPDVMRHLEAVKRGKLDLSRPGRKRRALGIQDRSG
jgi:hypothetical protein